MNSATAICPTRRIRTRSKAALWCSMGPRTITLAIDARTLLFMRGVGYPGSAEVVNMQPPAALIKQGIPSLRCIGDGRQSGTSGSPSILNASPEAAAGGGLALLKTGDRSRWAAPNFYTRHGAARPRRPEYATCGLRIP